MDLKAFYIFCVLFSLLSGEHCGQTVYGKIGENVYLHLRESHERSFHAIKWTRQNIVIAKTARSSKPFAEVFTNGTLKLHNVGRNCSGVYTAEAYDDQGFFVFKESSHLVVIDPPVVELVACILDVPVLHCAGGDFPDAVYEWRVSIQNQGRLKVSSHTGKFLALEYSPGNISCLLKMGNYSSQSSSYSLSCAGSARLVPETQLCVSLGVTVMLVLLCFMIYGISVGVQICRKRQKSNEKSEGSGPFLEMTQNKGLM
ncbi:T-cell surface antigen CD2-like isoform X4 [Anguilla anguilla]|uniref:T-cell surface antigen CD2-like isoform X4 n=1 Tax=Anguilla anguilla TaxID=7936 RepID=UPI0015A96C4E|nr:T-cell surface antigen CD2-like isoform X4 [Anguilla anguilla]